MVGLPGISNILVTVTGSTVVFIHGIGIFTNWLTGVSDRLSTLDMRVCGVPGTRILDMLSAK